jgi:hypothetical protein
LENLKLLQSHDWEVYGRFLKHLDK